MQKTTIKPIITDIIREMLVIAGNPNVMEIQETTELSISITSGIGALLSIKVSNSPKPKSKSVNDDNPRARDSLKSFS